MYGYDRWRLDSCDRWPGLERCDGCGVKVPEEEVHEFRETPLSDYVEILCPDCWYARESVIAMQSEWD